MFCTKLQVACKSGYATMGKNTTISSYTVLKNILIINKECN